MAVTRKPKPQPQQAEEKIDVEALIMKGGSVATPKTTQPVGEGKPSPVIVRIPSELLSKIEMSRANRTVKIPRHTWLLEAIVEKLERE